MFPNWRRTNFQQIYNKRLDVYVHIFLSLMCNKSHISNMLIHLIEINGAMILSFKTLAKHSPRIVSLNLFLLIRVDFCVWISTSKEVERSIYRFSCKRSREFVYVFEYCVLLLYNLYKVSCRSCAVRFEDNWAPRYFARPPFVRVKRFARVQGYYG